VIGNRWALMSVECVHDFLPFVGPHSVHAPQLPRNCCVRGKARQLKPAGLTSKRPITTDASTKKKATTRLEGYGSPRAAGGKGEQTPGAIRCTISHTAGLAFNHPSGHVSDQP
jgi:hypothetical protein